MIVLYNEQNEYFEKEIKKQATLRKSQEIKGLDKDKYFLDLPLDKEVENILEKMELIKENNVLSKTLGLNIRIYSSNSEDSEY